MLVTGLIWRANFEFLREAPSAKNRGIDTVKVVRGPDQKYIVLWFKFTDQTAGLLDQLNVMLRLNARISRKEAVHFVDKDDGRIVLFGAGEQISELLHRSPGGTAENVGCRNRIEAAFRLGGNQPGDHRLARAWRSHEQEPRWHWQLEPFTIFGIHQPDQVSKICFRFRCQNYVTPLDFFECCPVFTASFSECVAQVLLFDPSVFLGCEESRSIDQTTDLCGAPAGRPARKRLNIDLVSGALD